MLDDLETIIDKKIRKFDVTNLIKPGDNYGSLMLSVDVELEAGDKLHLVAKTPPANPDMKELFNIPTTFRNEIHFYKTIFPLLQDFQQKHKAEAIRFMPQYHGSRFNLDGTNDVIDENAVLLLENLKVVNYVNLNKTLGVDLVIAKIILKDLAQFHAVPLALKLKQPHTFAQKIRPYIETLALPERFNTDLEMKMWRLLNSLEEMAPIVAKIAPDAFKTMYVDLPVREPLVTVSHSDLWINNTMQNFEDGVSNKLVDFQLCEYGSPVRDVLFFLFTSVKMNVLRESCDDLLTFYYDHFVQFLNEYNIDGFELTRQQFDAEVKIEAKHSQLAHILLMFFPIFAPKEQVAEDFVDIKPSDFGTVGATKEHIERLVFVLKEFDRRDWL